MDSVDLLLLMVVLVLLLLLTLLAVAETGINRVSRVKAEALAERGGRRERALLHLVEEPDKFLNPVLLTVNILQTIQTALTTILLGRLFGGLGVVIGLVLNIVVLYVFTEAIPKTWAVLHSQQAALSTARPTYWLVRFWPLRLITQALIGMANWILPGRGLKQGPFVSERELLGYVEAAAEDEVIEHEERELIESIIEFGDTVAREIMVPRPDMITVPAQAKVTEALDLAIEHGFSRLPVTGENTDDVVGLAYTKDLMRAEREGRGFQHVVGLVRSARIVPETKPVARLMREMQAEKFHMALLVDEYGGISGLCTLEDCLEELVGEIVDEYDVESAEFERLPTGELVVDGGLSIDELDELIGAELPGDGWDTVGGFLLGRLGHVPEEGESVEEAGHRFTAQRVDGRRVAKVLISPISERAIVDEGA